MADVRLASYADLQSEIQRRENADEEISNKIETMSETSAQTIAAAQNSANAARSSADTAQSSADNALLRADEALSAANNAASAITETNSRLSSVNKNSLKRMVVQELPSKSVFYDFTDGVSKFTNSYRTACSVTENEGEIYQSITDSGNSNTYRRAYFDCSDIMNGATLVVAEFDIKLSGRWQLGMADLTQRPGESSGTNYTAEGVAFAVGTANGSTLTICNKAVAVSISGWLHIKAAIDFNTHTTEYVIQDKDTGETLAGDTVGFRDGGLRGITGFEAYTWQTDMLYIDNIKIVASYDAQDNVIYMIPKDGSMYYAYIYVDGQPVLIGANDTAIPEQNYSSKPVQIGTWIDGKPIWRVGFENIPIPYLEETPTLYTDKSYMPFFDYETGETKYVKSFNGVFMLNGLMLLKLSDIIYVGNRWCQLEFDFNIGNVQGFINHETMYISGYAEFVTEKDNIQE